MYLSEKTKRNPAKMTALMAMKPSEDVIDKAAMDDDELF